jgi:hypothetical protein
MSGIGLGISPMFNRGGVSYTQTMIDYLTRLAAEGGSLTSAEKGYLNTLTQNADTGEFDRLWVHGLSNQIAARISLVNALTADLITEVNAPTYSINGYTGNGTTQYINTNYNPYVNGVKFTQNNACFGVYRHTINASAGAFGVFTTPGGDKYLLLNGASAIRASVNDDNITLTDKLNSTGSISIGRSSATDKFSNVNGVDSTVVSIASTGLPNGNIFLLARNADNGGANEFQDGTISMSWVGSSNFDRLAFHNAVQTLGTSLGWAV